MYNSGITGFGHYLPEIVVTNKELSLFLGVTPEWIEARTGIKERRYADPDKDTTVSMGMNAALAAMKSAGIEKEQVSLLVFATQATENYSPGSAYEVQHLLNLNETPVLDIRGQCSGFLQALSIADQYIKSGMYDIVLVVASERNSSYLGKTAEDVATTPLFGDGAGAVILRRVNSTQNAILSTHLHADGAYVKALGIASAVDIIKDERGWSAQRPKDCGYTLNMNGQLVFRKALEYFPKVITEALNHNNLSRDDIKCFFLHQANFRILNAVQKLMEIPPGAFYKNIDLIGNTVSASIPISLSLAWQTQQIKSNDLVCLASFGSGFNWSSAVIRL